MAETDMKPISDLDVYYNKFDSNSLLPVMVRPNNSNITRKVYFNAFKTQVVGYEIVGTLTAGSTSITLSSVGNAYSSQNTYAVGDKVIYETKNYLCIKAITGSTDRNWANDSANFIEYTPLDADSTVEIYTTVFGVNPTDASVSSNAITLTFPSQSSNIGVKVRVLA